MNATDHIKPLYNVQSILLAEDDEDDSLIFREALAEVASHVQLQIVSNGLQLMKLLEVYMPALLFMDLEMPYKNGLECLVAIRAQEVLKPLPVIVFSSTTRHANIQTAYEMGAHLFLTKAYSYADHCTALRGILGLNWGDPDSVRSSYVKDGHYSCFG